jgi:hypothetical protein
MLTVIQQVRNSPKDVGSVLSGKTLANGRVRSQSTKEQLTLPHNRTKFMSS